MENYQSKSFLYQDLENEFRRYSAIINDAEIPVDELRLNGQNGCKNLCYALYYKGL
ncbi:hypothetical protein ACIRNY_07900 [Capnocytophaga canimorsus]|uniref:hypothetical protein n=1 Tax=Capnocytophaga canimorsus TaxID=28188 RepID=UPI00384B545D